jgi:hypothetical protein
MFQIDCWSHRFGGGTGSGGRPATPLCPSFELIAGKLMAGTSGPSGM